MALTAAAAPTATAAPAAIMLPDGVPVSFGAGDGFSPAGASWETDGGLATGFGGGLVTTLRRLIIGAGRLGMTVGFGLGLGVGFVLVGGSQERRGGLRSSLPILEPVPDTANPCRTWLWR